MGPRYRFRSAFGSGRLRAPLVLLSLLLLGGGCRAEQVTLVKDLNHRSVGCNPFPFGVVGGKALFICNDGVNRNALWKTDGTAAGTALITALPSNAGIGTTPRAISTSSLVFFVIQLNDLSLQLWRSDGTAAGTFSVHSEAYNGDRKSVV